MSLAISTPIAFHRDRQPTGNAEESDQYGRSLRASAHRITLVELRTLKLHARGEVG